MEVLTIILLGASLVLSIITGNKIHCEIGDKINAEIQEAERTDKDAADVRQSNNHDETCGTGD